jgi:16S rRNA (guanine527-N7)-methyltransferase
VTFREILDSELQTFQIDLNSTQKTALSAYCEELTRWNRKINLTGLSGADLVRRLVVEPVWIGLNVRPAGVLLDIGSGNGSPAVPLHVVCGFAKCHLVEARTKRAAFLRHVSAELKLPKMEIHRARFEEIHALPDPPDWVTLQAVAPTPDLMSKVRSLAGPNTTVIWITSSAASSQLQPSRMLVVPLTGTSICLFDSGDF